MPASRPHTCRGAPAGSDVAAAERNDRPIAYGLAAAPVDELPSLVKRGDRVFVQGAWDGDQKRVCLWGVDRHATAEAARIFVQEGYCARFLNSAWRLAGVGGTDLV